MLAVAALVTVVVAGLDVAGGPGPGALRAAGATVFGPLERVAGGAGAPASDPASRRLDDALAGDRQAAVDVRATRVARLLAAPEAKGRPFVPARVVAARAGTTADRVTIDVGSRDGVTEGLAVVAADGLVGRVTAVAPWTSDVVLVGSPELVAAVRVGRDGTLGSVSVGPAAVPGASAPLALKLVERGRAATGGAVTTLGGTAAGALPEGLRVGTVSRVETSPGSLTATGSVTPAVDRTTLDVVGVLLPTRRTTPRPAVTGGAG